MKLESQSPSLRDDGIYAREAVLTATKMLCIDDRSVFAMEPLKDGSGFLSAHFFPETYSCRVSEHNINLFRIPGSLCL